VVKEKKKKKKKKEKADREKSREKKKSRLQVTELFGDGAGGSAANLEGPSNVLDFTDHGK